MYTSIAMKKGLFRIWKYRYYYILLNKHDFKLIWLIFNSKNNWSIFEKFFKYIFITNFFFFLNSDTLQIFTIPLWAFDEESFKSHIFDLFISIGLKRLILFLEHRSNHKLFIFMVYWLVAFAIYVNMILKICQITESTSRNYNTSKIMLGVQWGEAGI